MRAAISTRLPEGGTGRNVPARTHFCKPPPRGPRYEALHTMIIALLENRPFTRDLEVLGRIGHTSGWDALAGAVVVLQAFSAIAERPGRL
jgi:hypothetical protein